MKRAILTIALLATCTAALATYPTPTPSTNPADIDVTLKQQQQAQADADAIAKAKADADAKAKAAADAESYGGGAAINDNSSTRMLVFPAPVWSTVPEARTCIATNSQAHAIGWNFWSHSKTEQKSDAPCIGVLMARSAYANCHFLSEALITQRVYATVFPGAPELPLAPDLRNLSLAECEALKKPRLVLTPSMTATAAPAAAIAPIATPVACVEPAPQAPAVRRIVKAKPKAPRCAI
jgi:hypothetical protein